MSKAETNPLISSGGVGGEEPKPEEIEALLDQVEKKFFNSPEAKKLSEMSPKDCPCSIPHPTDWKEVDEMLKDFQLEDSKERNMHRKGKTSSSSWNTSQLPPHSKVATRTRNTTDQDNSLKKCFTVYLSGSYEVMGYSVSGSEKPCDNIKCLNCDFSVVHFDNFSWHPSTDYLFLRNNMPDFERLASKLCRQKGFRAYGCQCHNVTTSTLINIMSRPELRWVCGRHLIQHREGAVKVSQ